MKTLLPIATVFGLPLVYLSCLGHPIHGFVLSCATLITTLLAIGASLEDY